MKGAPQGSVMGPFLFKGFLNDLVNYLEDKYDIYNYADDNAAGTSAGSIDSLLVPQSENDSWLYAVMTGLINEKENPKKLQFILIGKDNSSTLTILTSVMIESLKPGKLLGAQCDAGTLTILPGVALQSLKFSKLLGIQIDFQLQFDEHVTVLCTRNQPFGGLFSALKSLGKPKASEKLLKKKTSAYGFALLGSVSG